MPYILPEAKCALELYSDEAGVLTYRLQQTIQDFLLEAKRSHGSVRYADLATVLGCIEGLKTDFVDRVLLPYEHRKREENGDVWQASLAPLD